ncbi:uncharacterized protein LOC110711037 [Chenopodium quinoa]|uniref:uncharacterized protein LOC110711037 n=1 Tax=Chenopodium quinoa TaxID=63459 RepID=UPI000B76EC68|nr:uncharacterized protein LOC110711037 [Chenopodium quinoa]
MSIGYGCSAHTSSDIISSFVEANYQFLNFPDPEYQYLNLRKSIACVAIRSRAARNPNSHSHSHSHSSSLSSQPFSHFPLFKNFILNFSVSPQNPNPKSFQAIKLNVSALNISKFFNFFSKPSKLKDFSVDLQLSIFKSFTFIFKSSSASKQLWTPMTHVQQLSSGKMRRFMRLLL